MLCSYRSYSTSCMVGYSFIIFFGIFLVLGKVYAKDPFETIIKKHMVDVEKYKTEAKAKELMFKLIVINRDIGEYYKKGYDYKKNNIFKIVDLFIDDYNLEYPDAKLSEDYIRDYKKDLKTMMNSLPADFFINIVLNYQIYLSHIDSSDDRISINSFDPLDVGITIALIGTALYAVPNIYCRSIATVLISWGSLETYQNWQQLRMERKQKEKERRKREQKRQQGRDCSQCSKKCRDCLYCRKRQGW